MSLLGDMVRKRRETALTFIVGGVLSQNKLAKAAGIDVAYLHRIERGDPLRPSRDVVERLAVALFLGDEQTDELLAAAGYWPWGDVDADTLDAVLRVGRVLVNRTSTRQERTA